MSSEYHDDKKEDQGENEALKIDVPSKRRRKAKTATSKAQSSASTPASVDSRPPLASQSLAEPARPSMYPEPTSRNAGSPQTRKATSLNQDTELWDKDDDEYYVPPPRSSVRRYSPQLPAEPVQT